MIDGDDIESGFLGDPALEFGVQTGMNDVETLRVTKTNIIARGRRYGRLWLLKGLREELRDSSALRRQLQKEFEIHSRLHNPAVAQAVGFEPIPGLGLCIVEEWIEGKTLTELLREGKLTKAERRKILLEIIQAAGYLHSMGVVHRDLKPGNVMVRNAGKNVVLIDFGLADTDDYVELKLPAGTPGFISPEQQKKNDTTISDDIYSIGAIMKELTPEYGSIARRCTGELIRRPKDCTELIKLIDRQNRRPKIIRLSILVAGVLLLTGVASLHIFSLTQSAHEARLSISEARNVAADAQNSADEAQQKILILNETNRDQQDRMVSLKDSLNDVTARLTEAQDELRRAAEYDISKKMATDEGCREVDALIARYDRNVFSKFSQYAPECNAALNEMHSKSKEIIDKSCSPKKYPTLTDADRENIKSNIYSHYLNKFSSYHKQLLKRWYPGTVE